MASTKLSKWQKFKIWTSRSFGCASSYTIKDNDLPYNTNGKTRETIEESTEESTGKSMAKSEDMVDSGVTPSSNNTHHDKTEPSSTNKAVLDRSFSASDTDIPFIDASVVNIPQAVKK